LPNKSKILAKYFILYFFFFISILSFAQDKIILKNGTQIEGFVSLIGEEYLIYKKDSVNESAEISLLKSNVFLIIYQNGLTESFQNQTIVPEKVLVQEIDTVGLEKKIVKTFKNKEYVGFIIFDNGVEIEMIADRLGKIKLQKADIRFIENFEKRYYVVRTLDKRYLNDIYKILNNKYLIGYNAISQETNDAYVTMSLFGVEYRKNFNNFSIGGFSSWLSTPLVLNINYSKSINKFFHVGVNVLGGTTPLLINHYDYYFRFSGGMGMLNLTFGNKDLNVTFSGGYLAINDRFPFLNNDYNILANIYSMAGMIKIHNGFYFLFENNLALDNRNGGTIYNIMPGMRFYNYTHVFQIAYISTFYNGRYIFKDFPAFFAIPVVSWTLFIK
jgi:hypothetical protein